MVVTPLFNGMLSDGLMVRSMDVRSRIISGGVKVAAAVLTFPHIKFCELAKLPFATNIF